LNYNLAGLFVIVYPRFVDRKSITVLENSLQFKQGILFSW